MKIDHVHAEFLAGNAVSSTVTTHSVVSRDGSGNVHANKFKSANMELAHVATERTSDTVFYSSVDDVIRKNTAAGMRESLGLNNVNNTGATVAATADKIVLRDSGGDIFAAGVGIGTTSPRGMLDIYTGATSTAGLIIDRYASGTYRSELYQESNGLAIKVGDGSNAPAENMRITRSDVMIPGRLALGTSTASSSQFYISAPGNGTSTSTGDLHVNNSAGMTLYGTRPWITTTNGQGHTGKLCSINLHASGHQPAIEWTRDTGQGTNQRNWLLRQETDDALYTRHYNGSAWSVPMYVKSDAVISQVNVGIGVTDPDQKLEVRGNIKASYSDTNHGMFLDAGGTLRRDYGGAGAGFHFTNTAIWPTDYLGDYSAGGINFGDSSYRWNNVYTEELNASGEVITGNVLKIGGNTNDETAKTIYFGGTYGDNAYDHCVIERRVWSTSTEKQELLLFSGNDGESSAGPDRIRLKGGQILFDTLNNSTDRTTENTKMIIKANGNVGIGMTSPGYKLDVNGVARLNNVAFAAYRSEIHTPNRSYTGTVVFNNEYFDQSGNYDTGTGLFTAPVAGIYHFSFNAYTNQAGNTLSRLRLYKNNFPYTDKGARIEQHGNCIDVTIKLAANDTVSLRGHSSYPVYMYASSGNNIFCGHLLTAV